jgi:alkanesulfonate monooxygenase
MLATDLDIFSTCPQSRGMKPDEGADYLSQVVEVAQWSERAGCRGMLIYTDNAVIDPWLVAQVVIENTERLCPLVAVQPLYMHPYTVAKMVTSLGFLYRRRIYLNMVAGGFVNDLQALDDFTDHDERYRRLVEYTTIVSTLLRSEEPHTFSGDFYSVRNLVLRPFLSPDLLPPVFVSGSSPAGLAAARALGATAVRYPQRAMDEEMSSEPQASGIGMRIGIFARPTAKEAWEGALARFPDDRKGQLTHALAMRVSDSHWHDQLSTLGELEYSEEHPYWLGPFENYKTFCPYLVGSYSRVGEELHRYISLGFRTFVLDIPHEEEDLHHITAAFAAGLALDAEVPTGSNRTLPPVHLASDAAGV